MSNHELIENAYKIQNKLVSSFNGRELGYKIGFSSKATQEKFKISEPAYGKLFDFMFVKDKNIKYSDFVNLVVEIEITLKLSKDINTHLASVDEVKNYIDSFYPSIELPDLRVAKQPNFGAISLIEDNIAAKYFLLGKNHKYNGEDFTNTDIKLLLNNKLVRKGNGKSVLGSPINCLFWLANKLLSHGLLLKKGDIVLTGTITDIFEGALGDYEVLFSNPDEKINFSII